MGFASHLLATVPPWLRRRFGKPFVLGIGDVLDDLAQKSSAAVALRFPSAASPPDALAAIGTERRIPRGPGEPASSYAGRTIVWLDSHRTRGGPYAMLGQFFAYWRFELNVPVELVNQQGARWSMDTAGNITRDQLAGVTFGSFWAQDWIFFHTPQTIADPLVDSDGDEIIDSDGDGIDVVVDLASGVLPDDLIASFKLVPQTWAPAHLKRCTIVLLWGTGRVIGYPPSTIGSGYILGADAPIFIVIDF